MERLAHSVCLLAFLVFPGYVFLKAPGKPTHRAFALLGVAGLLFNGFALAGLLTESPAARLGLVNLAFLGAFLLLPVVVTFPGIFLGEKLHRTPRWLGLGSWVVAGLLALLASTDRFVDRIEPDGRLIGGWVVLAWTVVIGAAFVYFVWILVQRTRASEDHELTNRAHYLVLGAVIYALPSFMDLLHQAGVDHPLPFPLAPWGSLGFLVCVGVAVVKHRLLDIEVVLHRGLVLSLTAPALALCFVVLGELLEGAFRGNLPPDSPAPDVLAALVVALLFAPMSRLLGYFVETFLIAEFKEAPELRRFRQLPWLLGSEDVEGLKGLRRELDRVIKSLEARRGRAQEDDGD